MPIESPSSGLSVCTLGKAKWGERKRKKRTGSEKKPMGNLKEVDPENTS